ncbi:MAG: hypothetical protein IT210_05795 [Armatimonadetes bacterium]|nr:hypothetical protein [Armatimonadota bacterium]
MLTVLIALGAMALASLWITPPGARAKGMRLLRHPAARAVLPDAGAQAAALRRQAYSRLDASDSAGAILLLERSLRHDPDSYYAHYWMADSYYRLGYYSRAVASARQAARIKARGDAYLLLGMAYAAQDDRLKAAESLDRAVYQGVSSEAGYEMAARVLQGLKEGVNLALAPSRQKDSPLRKASPSESRVLQAQAARPLAPQPDELAVALALDKGEFAADEPLVVTVTVTNRGNRLLNLPEPDFRADGRGSLAWSLKDQAGRPLQRAARRLSRWIEPSDTSSVALAPGESAAYQCNLGSFFDILQSESYSVSVAYRWNSDPAAPDEACIFTGPASFRLAGSAVSAPPVVLAVNGQRVPLASQPVIARSRVLVSPEAVPAMGASLLVEKAISVRRGGKQIAFRLNRPTARAGSRQRTLDIAPITAGGRILLPLRAMVEGIGGQLFWNVSERKASVVFPSNSLNARARFKKAPVL